MNKLQSHVGFWLGHVAVIVALVVGVVVGWMMVRHQQAEVMALQHEREELPKAELQLATLKSQVREHAKILETVEEWVVTRDNILAIVGVIEKGAVDRSLEIKFEDIIEKQVFDAEGQLVTRDEPIQLIQLKIVALGDPNSLLEFLYGVEHLPFLLHLESWRLDAVSRVQPNRPVASDPEAEVPPPVGELTMRVVVGVRN